MRCKDNKKIYHLNDWKLNYKNHSKLGQSNSNHDHSQPTNLKDIFFISFFPSHQVIASYLHVMMTFKQSNINKFKHDFTFKKKKRPISEHVKSNTAHSVLPRGSLPSVNYAGTWHEPAFCLSLWLLTGRLSRYQDIHYKK